MNFASGVRVMDLEFSFDSIVLNRVELYLGKLLLFLNISTSNG